MSEPLLVARDLARSYRVGRGMFASPLTLKAVDGVSFDLAPGKTLAVVGESGCGKSTLGRLISMIERPSAGSLAIDGLDGADPANRRKLRRRVQIVFQDPYGSLNPRHKVGSILEEPLVVNTTLPRAERRQAAQAMMAKVGLRPEHYDRYPHMFSGGQRQRIAIARALMLNPGIVVADEPVSALDVSIQAQVLNLLLDLQRDFGVAYVFISHGLAVVRHIADDVMVMYLGRAVEQGPARTLFAAPRHPYSRALLAAAPRVGAARRERAPLVGEPPSPLDPPAGCAFHTRCPHATDRCAAERPQPREVDGRMVACHHAETIAA